MGEERTRVSRDGGGDGAALRGSEAYEDDVDVLRACCNALMRSSSATMLRANMEFLWDKFVLHPDEAVIDRFQGGSERGS